MNIKEIKELIEAVSEKGITELEVERAGVRVRIRKEGHTPTAVSGVSLTSSSVTPITHVPTPDAATGGLAAGTYPGVKMAAEEEDLYVVRSPIVGTFYRSPNPDSEPFVRVGDMVEPGRVLCIIEAMKLMNEIEAEVSGEIVKIYVENGEPVEFGQALLGIRTPKKVS